MEAIPSSCTYAIVTQCSLGRQTLQCPTHFLAWKSYPVPSHQLTHKRKHLHQLLPCVHEGTQQPQPYPEPPAGMDQAIPNSAGRNQAFKDTAVWPTLSAHFGRLAVSFKTQLLESGDYQRKTELFPCIKSTETFLQNAPGRWHLRSM